MLFITENECMKQAKLNQQYAIDHRGKILDNGSRAANARARVDVTPLAFSMTAAVLVAFVGLLYLLA